MSADAATPLSTGPGCVSSLLAAGSYLLVLNAIFWIVSLVIVNIIPGTWQSGAWLWTNGLAALPIAWLAWQAGARRSITIQASQALTRYESALTLLTAGTAGHDGATAAIAIATQNKARQALAAADRLRRDAQLSPSDEARFQTLTRQFLDQLTTVSATSYDRIDGAMNDYLAAIARLVAR